MLVENEDSMNVRQKGRETRQNRDTIRIFPPHNNDKMAEQKSFLALRWQPD